MAVPQEEKDLPVQDRVYRSLKLWSFYVDLEERCVWGHPWWDACRAVPRQPKPFPESCACLPQPFSQSNPR